ncbi:MAG: HlyD family efflux transporter periplasmic adaptor subunit [Magnetococcus sp. YQC-5]
MMANRGHLIWLWLTLVGVLAGGVAISGESGNNLEVVADSDGKTEIRAYLVPKLQTTLSSHIDAEIQRLSVKEGDTFTEGSPLVIFDCTTLKAQLNKAQTVFNAARDKNQVMQRLATLHSVGTMEADASLSEQKQAEAELKLQESRARGCQISAPFTGRVATLSVRVNQYVTTGQVLMKILDHRHLEMEMIVPSRWLTWLKPKSKFFLHIDETGKKYPAQVTRLGAEADPVSQSVKIVGELIGTHSNLIPGMSGAASFTFPEGVTEPPRITEAVGKPTGPSMTTSSSTP